MERPSVCRPRSPKSLAIAATGDRLRLAGLLLCLIAVKFTQTPVAGAQQAPLAASRDQSPGKVVRGPHAHGLHSVGWEIASLPARDTRGLIIIPTFARQSPAAETSWTSAKFRQSIAMVASAACAGTGFSLEQLIEPLSMRWHDHPTSDLASAERRLRRELDALAKYEPIDAICKPIAKNDLIGSGPVIFSLSAKDATHIAATKVSRPSRQSLPAVNSPAPIVDSLAGLSGANASPLSPVEQQIATLVTGQWRSRQCVTETYVPYDMEPTDLRWWGYRRLASGATGGRPFCIRHSASFDQIDSVLALPPDDSIEDVSENVAVDVIDLVKIAEFGQRGWAEVQRQHDRWLSASRQLGKVVARRLETLTAERIGRSVDASQLGGALARLGHRGGMAVAQLIKPLAEQAVPMNAAEKLLARAEIKAEPLARAEVEPPAIRLPGPEPTWFDDPSLLDARAQWSRVIEAVQAALGNLDSWGATIASAPQESQNR